MHQEAVQELLNNVVLHDSNTGRIVFPKVQYVYEGEDVPQRALSEAWVTVELLPDSGGIKMLQAIHADASIASYYLSNDPDEGHTLHIEGAFPTE